MRTSELLGPTQCAKMQPRLDAGLAELWELRMSRIFDHTNSEGIDGRDISGSSVA